MATIKKEKSDIPCRNTFAAAIDLFLKLAKEQARDGKISVDGLDLVAQVIQDDPAITEKYCDAQFERCSAHMRKSIRNTPRINVYGRIIAQPFEHLLNQNQPVLASAQLGNFFHAIEAILGRAKYETFMEISLRLMERVTLEKGSNFTHQCLYDDPESWEIRWDSLVAMATFFKKFQLRKEWYKRIMQSDPETPGQGTGPYPFSDFQFKSQMMCVFTDFTNLSDEELAFFEKRYSKAERKTFSSFLTNVVSIEEEA